MQCVGVPGMKMQSVLSSRAGKSKAMPFLSQPPKLDGSMAGDVGFDPLGLSTFLDVKWLREAELKHGRICMLAWTGCIVQVFLILTKFQQKPSYACHIRLGDGHDFSRDEP